MLLRFSFFEGPKLLQQLERFIDDEAPERGAEQRDRGFVGFVTVLVLADDVAERVTRGSQSKAELAWRRIPRAESRRAV